MSELKAFESERIYWAVEQVERVTGDIDSLHLDDNLFYIKSEADKVISEKDAEILRITKNWNMLCKNWNRLCEKYNKFIKLKQEFCDKFKDIELEITK